MERSFDSDKAIEALVYVVSKNHDLYAALKAFYFADKYHLNKYGRQMFHERYCALPNGPLPSNLYDYLKFVRGDGTRFYPKEIALKLRQSFHIDGDFVTNTCEADLDFLSQSEINCINKGLETVEGKVFDSIKLASDDQAYLKTKRNHQISLIDIVETLENAELVSECVD